MNAQRVAVLCLTLLLAGLFIYSVIAGVGDLKTRGMLLIGSLLGAIYATRGSLPDSVAKLSGGRLTSDDDPANLSPRLYLTVLLAVIVIAGIVFGLGWAFL